MLVLITLLGAALRFAWLDHPAIWGDEAATWARTCGTFQDMLKANRTDGFVPLHYELYWLMGKCWTLTPWRMRLVPAVAGTLLTPAMYFLARQLIRPKTALLVALFAATSAYFLNYSRDAKMYIQTWLMATLFLGCFIWWLQRGNGVVWWAWVASGVAAVGLHASAWFVVAVGVLLMLTSGRPRRRWLLCPLGIAIMASGPVVYHNGYDMWMQRSGFTMPGMESGATSGNWRASGFAWIDVQMRNKTGPQLVRESATAYLFGYSRAEEEPDANGAIPIAPAVLNAAWGALAGMLLTLLAGMVRWPRKTTALEARPPWHGWQLLLWLGAWLILPTYGFFYCESTQAPASPWDWVKYAAALAGWQSLWALPAAAVVGWLAGRYRPVLLAAAWILALALLGIVGVAIWRERAAWHMALLRWTRVPWVVVSLVALMISISWAASAADARTRWRLLIPGFFALVSIMAICQAAWFGWDYARHSANGANTSPHSLWMPRYLAFIAPAVIIVMAIAVMRLPGRIIPALVAAAFVGVNLAQYGATLVLDPEPRVDLVAADLVGAERDANYVVFFRDKAFGPSPGSATVNDLPTRYYLAIHLGGKYGPDTIRNATQSMLKRPMNRMRTLPSMVEDLKRRPNAHHLILWERLTLPNTNTTQTIAKALGPDWQLDSEWSQDIRRRWNWQDMDTYRRLEFVRFMPATQPSTRPAGAALVP